MFKYYHTRYFLHSGPSMKMSRYIFVHFTITLIFFQCIVSGYKAVVSSFIMCTTLFRDREFERLYTESCAATEREYIGIVGQRDSFITRVYPNRHPTWPVSKNTCHITSTITVTERNGSHNISVKDQKMWTLYRQLLTKRWTDPKFAHRPGQVLLARYFA